MSQKQSASPHYPHFGHIYSEMGKENKLTCRNFIIYLQTKNKKKNEMRWKWSVALNNEMRMNEIKMQPCI